MERSQDQYGSTFRRVVIRLSGLLLLLFFCIELHATVTRIESAQGKLYINGVTTSTPFLSTSQTVEVRGDNDFVQFYLANKSLVRLENGRIRLKALRALRTTIILERGRLFLNVKTKADQYFDLITDYMRLELGPGLYYINHNRDRTYFAVFSGNATHIKGLKRDKISQFSDLKNDRKGGSLKGMIPQTIWDRSRSSFKKLGATIP